MLFALIGQVNETQKLLSKGEIEINGMTLFSLVRVVKVSTSIRLTAVNISPEERMNSENLTRLQMSDLLNMEMSIGNVEVVLLNAASLGDHILLMVPDQG